MSAAPPLARIPVGVVVERGTRRQRNGAISCGGRSRCCPACRRRRRGRVLREDGERDDVLCRRAPRSSCIARRPRYYRDNLAIGAPLLWVVLSPTEGDPPYRAVDGHRRSGRGRRHHRERGANLVEPVPMPERDARDRCGVRRRAPCRRAVHQAQARPRRSRGAGAAAPTREGTTRLSDRRISSSAGRAANSRRRSSRRERLTAKAERDEASTAAPATPVDAWRAGNRQLRSRRTCRRSNSISAETDIAAFFSPACRRN